MATFNIPELEAALNACSALYPAQGCADAGVRCFGPAYLSAVERYDAARVKYGLVPHDNAERRAAVGSCVGAVFYYVLADISYGFESYGRHGAAIERQREVEYVRGIPARVHRAVVQ